MLISNSKEKQITSNEVIEVANKAYDRGGADALALIIETAHQLAEDQPDLKAYCGFTIHMIEAVRQRLAEAVNEQVHDIIPEESGIII